MSVDLTQVLIRPLLSEKSYNESDLNKYRFQVRIDANKQTVRRAVEKMFGVEVVDVNTSRVHGKTKRTGRHINRKSDWKKAVVTLKDGESLDFFEKFDNA